MTQPDESPIEEVCAKASNRAIVDRLYPEDDDTAFNGLRNFSTKDPLRGIHELSKAQMFSSKKPESCPLSCKN